MGMARRRTSNEGEGENHQVGLKGMDLEITYLSLITINFNDYHFHLLQ